MYNELGCRCGDAMNRISTVNPENRNRLRDRKFVFSQTENNHQQITI